MAYGELKVDSITFTDGGSDTTVSVSGLVKNPTFSGDIVVSGNISGITITGDSAGFGSVTGVTVTGTTANFVTVSGTTVTGGTGNFTSISATTTTITSGVFASGTAAAPSVSVGTTDNGFYSPGTDQVAISTSGTGRLFVDASGNVGVNIANPTQKLHIKGSSLSSTFNGLLLGDTNERLRIGYKSGSPDTGLTCAQILSDTAQLTLASRDTSNGAIAFNVGSGVGEKARITSDGKLGLGTSSPDTLLHLSSGANTTMRLTDTAGSYSDIIYNESASVSQLILDADPAGSSSATSGTSILLKTDGNTAMTIDSSQRVGIGTSSPGATLDVAGDAVIGNAGTYGQLTINKTAVFDASDVPTSTTLYLTNSSGGTEGNGNYGPSIGFGRINNSLRPGGAIATVQTSSDGDQCGVAFLTHSSAATSNQLEEALRITHDGKVGIGTTAPLGILHARPADECNFVVREENTSLVLSAETNNGRDSNRSMTLEGSEFVFNENGSEKARIDSSGRLGLGTSSPDAKLKIQTVSSDIPQSAFGIRQNNAAETTQTTLSVEIDPVNSTSRILSSATSNPRLALYTSNQVALYIDESQRVGIGTTSPDSPLNVRAGDNNTSAEEIASFSRPDAAVRGAISKGLISGTTNGIAFGTSTNHPLALNTNGTERIYVTNGGNVGIGTTSPSNTLHVRKDSDSNVDHFYLQNRNTGANAGARIAFSNGGIDYSDNRYAYIGAIKDGATGNHLVFAPNASGNAASEAVRITSDGKLGLGTSSPGSLLHTVGARDYTGSTPGTSSYDVNFQSGTAFVSIGQSNGIPTIQGHGSGTSYNLALCPNAGKVGIGTTSPLDPLHVLGPDGASGNPSLSSNNIALFQNDGGTTDGAVISVVAGNAAESQISLGDVDNANIGAIKYDNSNNSMTFVTNSNPGATIDSSGRLLVGTSSWAGGNAAFVIKGQPTSGPGTQYLSYALPAANITNNTTIGYLYFSGRDGEQGAFIRAVTEDNWAASDYPTGLVFATTADGASSPTERMRITSGGLVGIATTAKLDANSVSLAVAGSFPDTPVEIQQDGTASHYAITFHNGNGLVGSITTNGSATVFNTSSDYRLKENVVPLTGAANRLNQLQVHRFNFIADPDTTVDGFLAHEAQAVVPECVTGTKDEVDDEGNPVYQGIDQSKLVPLLTAALQEAMERIETLEAKVAALEAS